MEVSSYEDATSEFCCVGSTFSMKLLKFVSKAIIILTELVGQCRNILPLGCGKYIPALTSHSVNKSIFSSCPQINCPL